MYKVYLDSEKSGNQNIILDKIINETQKILIKEENIIVYTKDKSFNMENILLNAYVLLSCDSKLQGPEAIINENSNVSNGLAKEIYNKIYLIYYDNKIDNGVIYLDDIFKNSDENTSCVKVNLVSKNNTNDLEWINNKYLEISNAIANGIISSLKLKKC